MTNIIELANQAGLYKDLLITDECHERLKHFAKLCGNAALEQAKQLEWTEIMREGALVTWGDADTLGDRVIEKLESLKEPTP